MYCVGCQDHAGPSDDAEASVFLLGARADVNVIDCLRCWHKCPNSIFSRQERKSVFSAPVQHASQQCRVRCTRSVLPMLDRSRSGQPRTHTIELEEQNLLILCTCPEYRRKWRMSAVGSPHSSHAASATTDHPFVALGIVCSVQISSQRTN